jgi:hypothetical protein
MYTWAPSTIGSADATTAGSDFVTVVTVAAVACGCVATISVCGLKLLVYEALSY